MQLYYKKKAAAPCIMPACTFYFLKPHTVLGFVIEGLNNLIVGELLHAIIEDDWTFPLAASTNDCLWIADCKGPGW